MKSKSYFAAANGYSGFRSYFDNVFPSEEFRRIFVLKGGPGTGKSTLMRRVVNASLSAGSECDMIHCSSDPDSLDGVIVYTKSGKYAVIDGTAPHERDAVIPGAIDSILNLGEGFDISGLKMRREEIVSLNRNKKIAYSEAYKDLKAAGALKERLNELITVGFNYEKAERIVDSIASKLIAKAQTQKIALRRAFCKHGYFTLDDFPSSEQSVKIYGEYGEESKILDLIADKCRQNCSVLSYDPLCEYNYDALVAEDATIVCTADQASNFSTICCIDSTVSREELDFLKSAHSSLLTVAAKKFETAALLHFDLEAIYSSCMDFSLCDDLFNKIINDIF